MTTQGLEKGRVNIWTIGELSLILFDTTHLKISFDLETSFIISGKSPRTLFIAFLLYGIPGIGFGRAQRHERYNRTALPKRKTGNAAGEAPDTEKIESIIVDNFARFVLLADEGF